MAGGREAAPTGADAVFEAAWAGFEHSSFEPSAAAFSFAGTPCRISVADDDLARALLPAISRRHVAALEEHPVELRVWSGPFPGLRPHDLDARTPSTSMTRTGDVVSVFDPTHRNLSIYHRRERRGVWWTESLDAIPSWERSAPFRHLFHWMLADAPAAVLHAASVGTDVGGVLLVGPGGAGKSTAALACVDAGWRYVADDYCALRVDETPTAWNLYGTGKLTPSSAGYLDGLDDARIEVRPGDDKSIYDLGSHRGAQVTEHLALRAIVVPSLSPTPTDPIPLAAGTAALSLLPSTLLQLPGARPAALAVVTTALRSLPVFSVGFGPDRADAPRQLARVLAHAV